jgi:hypothetical protein
MGVYIYTNVKNFNTNQVEAESICIIEKRWFRRVCSYHFKAWQIHY